jgi:hypothetical protein
VRIPGWCDNATLRLNGQPLDKTCLPGTFVTIERTFQPGDLLELHLPMNLALRHWPRGGVSLDLGPLAFALEIREKWQVDTGDVPQGAYDERFESGNAHNETTQKFPKWEITPESSWNFALALDTTRFAEQIRIERRPLSGNAWTQASAPVRLHLPARRVRGWDIHRPKEIENECVQETDKGWIPAIKIEHGDFAFTPQLPDPAELPGRLEPSVETVTLVPYGCTRLRLSIFPFADNNIQGILTRDAK